MRRQSHIKTRLPSTARLKAALRPLKQCKEPLAAMLMQAERASRLTNPNPLAVTLAVGGKSGGFEQPRIAHVSCVVRALTPLGARSHRGPSEPARIPIHLVGEGIRDAGVPSHQ